MPAVAVDQPGRGVAAGLGLCDEGVAEVLREGLKSVVEGVGGGAGGGLVDACPAVAQTGVGDVGELFGVGQGAVQGVFVEGLEVGGA